LKTKQFFDNTIDIRFNGKSAYRLKKHEWNADKIEKQVTKLVYNGANLPKDEEVEKAKLPPFALHFFNIVFEEEKIPTVDYFLESYFNTFFEKLDNEHVKPKDIYESYGFSTVKLNKDSIRYRFLRTIPSLIRDFHFTFLLYENSSYKNVYYSLNQDYFEGYDIILKHNNEEIGISIYVKTKRSESYKRKKRNRHNYDIRKEIELAIDLNECKKAGNIYLLTIEHVKKLEKLIDNGDENE
jgi:hypothetical protein